MADQQGSLFDKEPAPWDEADQSEHLVATVVFTEGPTGRFDYVVPDRLAERVEAGRRVRAPLGRANRIVTGYCVAVASRPAGGRRLKPLHSVVDRRSLLPGSLLGLTEWIAEHYLCRPGCGDKPAPE